MRDSPYVAARNALSAIIRSGARNNFEVPGVEEVLRAPNGKAWYGEKKDGSHWKLQKHGQDSYNVIC